MSTPQHSPAEIIQQLLIANALGTDKGDNGAWPVFYSHSPDKPNDMIVVRDTTGVPDGRSFDDGETVEHPGIQITIRSVDKESGYFKAREIAGALDSVSGTSADVEDATYIIQNASRVGPINHLGIEPERRRHLHTINYVLTIPGEGEPTSGLILDTGFFLRVEP